MQLSCIPKQFITLKSYCICSCVQIKEILVGMTKTKRLAYHTTLICVFIESGYSFHPEPFGPKQLITLRSYCIVVYKDREDKKTSLSHYICVFIESGNSFQPKLFSRIPKHKVHYSLQISSV